MMALFPRLGFDAQRLRFASYTAVACIIALLIAWAMGLEHPQWAGMSVWAASQPLRGQAFEKSFYRALGTLAGVIVGIGLVLAMQISPYLLVIGLALWSGFCTRAANLYRGIPSYGIALAGYSAAMVALLDTAHPDKVFALGLDRFLTVLTGVAVATLAGAIFAQGAKRDDVKAELRALVVKALRAVGSSGQTPQQIEALLREIALFEDGLEPHAAGSKASRNLIRSARRTVIELTLLILRLPALSAADRTAIGAHATTLAQGEAAEETPAAVRPLVSLLRSLDFAPQDGLSARQLLHRDLHGAHESGLRAGGVVFVVGMVWQLTGWPQGSYLLLGLSVMLSVFSTIELPTFMLKHVAVGQVLAAIAALACQMLVWPHATSTLEQILMLVPFILGGIFLTAHRRTALASLDYHLVFLLLMMPRMPYHASFSFALTTALAVVAAPVLALLCYKTIFPVDLERRARNVEGMFRHDLAAIVRNENALSHRAQWNSRFAHCSLRLLRLHQKLGRPSGQSIGNIETYAQLGRAAFWAHEVLATPAASDRQRRLAQQVLARLAQDPSAAKASVALDRLAQFDASRLGMSLAAEPAL